MSRPRLMIYAKPPSMGVSKTRLAAGLGRTEARRIASFLLSHTLRCVRASGCETVLYVSPDRAALMPGAFGSTRLPLCPQGPGTLTEKLGRGFDASPNGPVIFIGTDAPGLSPALLRQAVRALSRHDAVFGPASDGGFWLFGLHKRAGMMTPFDNVRWSGPHAMADVEANLPARARIARLVTLTDIDKAEDWEQWQSDN